MTAHAWYIENRAGFVARSLERGEERTFRDHLVRCDECTREVARLERELGWLPMGVAPVAPPPGFARQMAAEILDRPEPVAALGSARGGGRADAGVAGRVDERAARGSRAAERLAVRESRLAALEDTLSVLRRANMVLQTQISMDGHDRAAC